MARLESCFAPCRTFLLQHLLAFGGEVDPSTKGHEGAGDFSADLWCWHAGEVGRLGAVTLGRAGG